MTNGMDITKGPRQDRSVPNFFDDDISAPTRELLFNGKPYSQLTPAEQKRAVSEAERKHRDRMGGWAFLVGLGGFCFLLAVHLTAFGIVFVAAVVALVCWAMVTRL